jgi:hypothetical protein
VNLSARIYAMACGVLLHAKCAVGMSGQLVRRLVVCVVCSRHYQQLLSHAVLVPAVLQYIDAATL